jgi:hypothetical protein
MTFTVIERITANVVEALSGIRVVAGCRFDATVEEVAATTNTAKGDVFLQVYQSEPGEAAEGPINFDDYEVVYNIAYRRVALEADLQRAPDALHAEVFGEVKRAIMADQKLGGLAIRTFDWAQTKGRTEGSGAIEGEVSFTVHTRTVQDDMFASAFE